MSQELAEYLNGRVVVTVGDITLEASDAVVNAANSTLLGGGGVDGAIHRKGGPKILEECKKIRAGRYPEGLPAGEAVVTAGGNLAASFVIHTVGPVWSGGKRAEEETLRNCYLNSLKIAALKKCGSLSFPAISTGVYRFPKEKAAQIASHAIGAFLKENKSLKKIRLVFFSEEDARIFMENQELE